LPVPDQTSESEDLSLLTDMTAVPTSGLCPDLPLQIRQHPVRINRQCCRLLRCSPSVAGRPAIDILYKALTDITPLRSPKNGVFQITLYLRALSSSMVIKPDKKSPPKDNTFNRLVESLNAIQCRVLLGFARHRAAWRLSSGISFTAHTAIGSRCMAPSRHHASSDDCRAYPADQSQSGVITPVNQV
jgi:hypothetical protein